MTIKRDTRPDRRLDLAHALRTVALLFTQAAEHLEQKDYSEFTDTFTAALEAMDTVLDLKAQFQGTRE